MEQVPGHIVVGARVAAAIDESLSSLDAELEACGRTSLTSQVLQAIGAAQEDVSFDESYIERIRVSVAAALECDDWGPICVRDNDGRTCQTCVRGHLLHRWAVLSGDPAAGVAEWTWLGAPGGIAEDFSQVEGVFPRSVKLAELSHEDLDTDLDGFANYDGTFNFRISFEFCRPGFLVWQFLELHIPD